MSEYEFTISLRLRHPKIDPASIPEALGSHSTPGGRASRVAIPAARSSRATIARAIGWDG
jgi:hypothetical protein